MRPTNFQALLEAGYRPDRDFRVGVGNLLNVAHCLLVAPHGGRIEPGTTEIMLAVAALHGWAYYHFDGLLPKRNWENLHIASTKFDEPTLLGLLSRTQFVLSFHGERKAHTPTIYVGGLHDRGRAIVLHRLKRDVASLGVASTEAVCAERGSLAGRSLRNLTNRGALGAGVQLEFSREVRSAFRRGGLDALGRAIDRALLVLTSRR
jgi:phage replication-related protein YjqB (UPF0714/DUF867 family)